jgi:transposase InsO family protein
MITPGFCVIAAVTERATGRAVCLALAGALARFGVPEEILTDNGKQFTDRFGKGGEVLFDKICRKNGITHRLTAPASPATTGKVERFHQTLRRELLDGRVFGQRPGPRWMPGSPSTTPTGPTRPSMAARRSPRPTGSPRCHRPRRNSSTYGCRLRSPWPAAPAALRSPPDPAAPPQQAAGRAGPWSSTG